MNAPPSPAVRNSTIGRSILAVLAGIVVGIVLSVGTDGLLRLTGIAPAQSMRWPGHLLVLATIYRSIYGIIAAWIIARLAPNRLMGHALVAGALGMLVSVLGAIAAWNTTAGQHWYPIALALTAIPTAWMGAKLRLMQLRTEPATA